MKRIVYTVTSLRNRGGLERVLINKANWLINNGGYEVSIITEDVPTCCYPVDSRIKIFALDIKKPFSKYSIIRAYRFILFLLNYWIGISRLLRGINPDMVVSVSARDFFILPFVNRKSKKIYEFHWIVSRTKKGKKRLKDRAYDMITDIVGNCYDSIVLLTKADKEASCHNWKTVHVIPNAITFPREIPSTLERKRAIAVGNLFHIKGFSRLIDVWNIVHKQHPDWSLSIYGEGYLKEELQTKINDLSLTDVVKLEGSVNDIKKCYQQSSMALISSYEESFSMALLEAQSCGLPTVAFDCPFGPSEIITDGVDGFIVPNDDILCFADRVCLLIENTELRRTMGLNAFNNVERFSESNVMPLWVELFDE